MPSWVDVRVLDLFGESLHLSVNGYLPAACRIERREEYIPAHVGYVTRVVCTGGEESEESE